MGFIPSSKPGCFGALGGCPFLTHRHSPLQSSADRGYLPKEAGFVHLAHNYVRHDCPGREDVNLDF